MSRLVSSGLRDYFRAARIAAGRPRPSCASASRRQAQTIPYSLALMPVGAVRARLSSTAAASALGAPVTSSSAPAADTALIVSPASAEELEARFGGPKEGDTIVVALSGGVDSSTTLARLCLTPSDLDSSRPKFDIQVVFMRNWNSLDEGDDFEPGASGGADGCAWVQDWKDVQTVTAYLRGAMQRKFPLHAPAPIQGPVIRSSSYPPQFPTSTWSRSSNLLPLHFLDLSSQYWTDVFEPALELWGAGHTPNPDVSCNRSIKFGALIRELFGQPQASGTVLTSLTRTYLERRAAEGKAWLATGHYAGLRWERDALGRPRVRLVRSADPGKDQTYYMSSIHEEALRYAVFPLSEMHKPDVKKLARDLGLPTAERAESMGLCFVGERQKIDTVPKVPTRAELAERLAGITSARAKGGQAPSRATVSTPRPRLGRGPRMGVSLTSPFASFVANYLPMQSSFPGKLVQLETGEVLAEHSGLHTLTLGQNARIAGRPQKAYVARKERVLNRETQELEAVIYVVDGNRHPALLCEQVYISQPRFDWIGPVPAAVTQAAGLRVLTQIRHCQEPLAGTIRLVPHAPPGIVPPESEAAPETRVSWYQVTFDEPIHGVAPGQVTALWDFDGTTLGSGLIQRVHTTWDRQVGLSGSGLGPSPGTQ